MSKVKQVEVKAPSVLAFSRTIEPTDGFFYQKNSQDENPNLQPVVISKRSIRTTMSNRQKPALAKNPEKLNAEIIKANLQTPEICYLEEDCDIMVVKFGTKFLPFDGDASSCNSPDFLAKIKAVVADYQERTQFTELGLRYATNIANGRWLWRNRFVAQDITVAVECTADDEKHSFTFAAKKLSIKEPVADNEDVAKLGALIAAAFRGEVFLSLYITADVNLGYGHQAFPSEEMNLDDNKAGKELFHRRGVAGFHAPKIGNALRTIDTWYPNTQNSVARMPISVEPFGSVTSLGIALRQPSAKADFYTLFDEWMENDVEPSIESQHYIMAMLMRGGVFGKSSK